MISVDRLSVSFGGNAVFRQVSLLIGSRDKIGLVGRNGAGKTTLLKVLMNLQHPDEGKVVVPAGIRLGYLPQQMVVGDSKTLMEEAGTAFDEILLLEREIGEIEKQIGKRTDYESEAYLDLISQLTDKTERFHLLEGGSRDQKIEQVLSGLGFRRSDFGRETCEFSGGWRMRIELAKTLLRSPDVILLDEPTNHLDIDSIRWLEEFLHGYRGGVILISHDRAFLDRVTNRTVEISMGNLYDYRVPYSAFVQLRRERREQQAAAYKNQQKLIADTNAFIERFRYKPTKAVQVQSRIRMLEKLERLTVDGEDTSDINIRFPPAPHSGSFVVQIRDLRARYGNHVVLDQIDLSVHRGEKVAFVGRNGEGKTTLSRIIAGELPYEGTFTYGHQVRTAYFAQNQDELLDGSMTVFETVDRVAAGEIRHRLRDVLGAFLFSGDEVDKKVSVLSGGERSRLAMAMLLLTPCNLLILDEPTNHLDMRSKDVLKQALLKYDGTLIVVSHDREFLDKLVGKVFEFSGGKVREHMGGINDFLNKRNLTALADLEKKENAGLKCDITGKSMSRQSFILKKQADREIRIIENQIRKTEENIGNLESQIKRMDSLIEDPAGNTEGSASHDLYGNYAILQDEMNRELDRWESLHRELDRKKSERK